MDAGTCQPEVERRVGALQGKGAGGWRCPARLIYRGFSYGAAGVLFADIYERLRLEQPAKEILATRPKNAACCLAGTVNLPLPRTHARDPFLLGSACTHARGIHDSFQPSYVF